MTSNIFTSISQCITKGDYAGGLNLIDRHLENRNLKETAKEEILYWKAYLLVQNQIIRFPFFMGQKYQLKNFEKALSIIKDLELLNLTASRCSRLNLLKLKIFRTLKLEKEQSALFNDLVKVFDNKHENQSSQDRALFLQEKALYLNTQGDSDDVISILKNSIEISLDIKEYENAMETLFI